jgi:hypothetical protein
MMLVPEVKPSIPSIPFRRDRDFVHRPILDDQLVCLWQMLDHFYSTLSIPFAILVPKTQLLQNDRMERRFGFSIS